jgi:hypothetical protein
VTFFGRDVDGNFFALVEVEWHDRDVRVRQARDLT